MRRAGQRVGEPAGVGLGQAQHLVLFSWPSGPKSRPVASLLPSTETRRAPKLRGSASWRLASSFAEMSQYEAETNFIRSRSRSTTMRVATDCTRPADRPRVIFFHRTGLTS